MQTCLLLLGIVLTGQINDSGGPRYSSVPAGRPLGGSDAAATPPATGQLSRQYPQQPPQQLPLGSEPLNFKPLRPAAPPASTPPEAGTARLAKVVAPVELLRALSKPAGAEKLAGTQLSLAETVQSAGTRHEQTRRVKLYWELSQSVAEFRLVALEAVQLKSIYDGLGFAQRNPTWQQAQQTIAARSKAARSAVRVAQLRLQKELERTSDGNLPLPSDLPHCGAYQTRFEEIFQGRTSGEAQQLSQLLPLRHQELQQRALSTVAALESYSSVSQQRSPQSDGTELLKAYENLALQRCAFVATAYQYNANIVRYTALAVPQKVGAVRLVAMLIPSEAKSSSDRQLGGNWQRGAIQRATAEQALPESGAQSSGQRTFVEEGRSRALRVPAEVHGEERSILVAPRTPQR